MATDPTVETPDVPIEQSESIGGTVGTENTQAPFELNKYKQGGKVQGYTNNSGKINLGAGRVSTAEKNSKSPKW